MIVSHTFAHRITGAADPAHLVDHLWTKERKVVVITAGELGCWYKGESFPLHHQPAFPVKVVDTTGCGDVFHGAYAAGLAEGLALPERIRLATATAALKATARGGQAGIPHRSAVEAFLQQHVS